jgi:hypothetical protein
MATTTNYGWTTPNDSDAFKLGASAIRTLGSAIDTTLYNLNQGDVSYNLNTGAALTLTTTTETALMNSPSFTPVAGRLYEVTISIGRVSKTTSVGNITIRLRKDSVSGTVLDATLYSAQPVSQIYGHSKVILLTSTQMGTSAFVPTVTVQVNGNGATFNNNVGEAGVIIIKDIGAA